ncbi:MAG TPA: DUF1801 domain-containing protein [Anaerolineaceae bacterium]|nr:DUF1801 domain-containing protein [Anaerolineaceae bacterium]
MKPGGFSNTDEYIALFPLETQALLQEVRAAIKSAAPDAQEKISYQMPAFYQKGILVYFAAWKTHIGLYPASSGVERFREELADYEFTKGTIKFPNDKPLPLDLIKRIVRFRLEENERKSRK